MTYQEIEALKRLDIAATDGPWLASPLRVVGQSPGCDIGAADGSNIALVHHEWQDRSEATTLANAALFVASRTAIPALIATVEELAGALKPFAKAKDTLPDVRHAQAILAKLGEPR